MFALNSLSLRETFPPLVPSNFLRMVSGMGRVPPSV
jgi:hypothetical protein